MVIAVVSINIVIALLGFYTAWRIWRMGQTLTQVANRLAKWEQQAQQALKAESTPVLILRGRKNTAQLRRQYAQLQGQLQQVRQIVYLVSLVPWFTRTPSRRAHSSQTPSRQRHSN